MRVRFVGIAASLDQRFENGLSAKILSHIDDRSLNEALTHLIQKKRKLPHNDKRRMVNFFRFSDASSHYPLTPVLAMLRLIQNKYAELDDGRHQVTFHNFMNKLSQCQSLQCQEVHSAIWRLVRSGNIGSRLGQGRLRGALKEVCQSIDAGRPLDVDEVLSRLCSKRNVYGFLNR